MPLDPSIPLRAVSGRRNNLVEEYAQAVNIKNAIAQQKAAEAEASRQENVRNALSKAVNPQTGEVDWNSAVNSVATVDPMTALSLRGELAKEQASGYDMKAKQIEYYTKAFDQAAQMAPTITDQAGWDSLRQWAYGIDPNLAERIPREFTPQNAQALAMTALDLKDRISIRQGDRTFAAQEAERRREYERTAAEHYDKTGERLPPYEAASGGVPAPMPAGAPESPERMKGVIYDFTTLKGDANDPNTPAGYYNFMKEAAPILSRQLGIPEEQLLAMPAIESGMNPAAVSGSGVEGPWMLTENTAAAQGMPNRDDDMQNTYGGATYYADMFKEFGDPALAAAAYNSGPGPVRQALQWSKDTGAPWEQSGYVRPEGVQHSRKFVEQIRVIRQMADAQKADVEASDAPPAMKREAKKAIDAEARKAEMDLAAETQDQKPVGLVTLKLPDKSFKTYDTMDREGIAKALADGAIEVPAATAAKGSAPNGGIPTQALRLQQEELDALSTASNTNADLGAIKTQVETGKLDLGLYQNVASQVRNYAGYSNENSKAFASFKATLEKLRNDSLRLNKGVQTEGDAVRAWNELMASINDPEVVKQRLGEIMAINERAANIRKMNIDVIRQNYGADPLDYAAYMNPPAAVGGQPQGPAEQMPKVGDIVDGFRFKGNDPSDPKNWERAQ